MSKPTVFSLWFGGQTGVSNALDLSMVDAVVGIVVPANWTPAVVSVEGSPNGTDFYPLYDGMTATDLKFNVAPGTMVAINPNRLRCCQAIRLRSGGHDAPPIPQGMPREFFVIAESTAP